MMSTFNMLIYGPKITYKCHKTLSCNLFGVMQQFDSTTRVVGLVVILWSFATYLAA